MYWQWLLVSWFPGAGNRNNSTGVLTNVGVNGYLWCSSPNASGSANGGYFLSGSDGTVNTTNNTNRANALTVRCVSELASERRDQMAGSVTKSIPGFAQSGR